MVLLTFDGTGQNQNITAINWSGKDPFFPMGATYESEMADYIDNDFDTDANIELNIGVLEFINTYTGEPAGSVTWTPLEKWNILVGMYLNAKGKVRDNYIETELLCEFRDDNKAIVSRYNSLPLNLGEAAVEVAGDVVEHCEDLCEGSVANWMYELELQCPAAFSNSANAAAWEQVRSLLQSYCLNGCIYNVNPLGIISQMDVPPANSDPLWTTLIEPAESMIDGLFAGAGCTAVDQEGILDDEGILTATFTSTITYDYVVLPADSPSNCASCDILKSFIDFGEWVLVDPANSTYEWQSGHWNISGLNDYMQAAGISYYITPFHVINAIKQCNIDGYSFHGTNEFCSGTAVEFGYNDNIESYLSNFLGCPGVWSIDGYTFGGQPLSGSLCDLSNTFPSSIIPQVVQETLDAIELCGEEKTQYYWDLGIPSPSNLTQATAEFNEAYDLQLTESYFQRLVDLYHKTCTTQNADLCQWPTISEDEDLINDIENLPCGNFNVYVTVSTGYTTPTYDQDDFTACIEDLTSQVTFEFYENYSDQIDELLTDLNQQRVDNCLGETFGETLKMDYFDLEYQYTLYYYDQAGNLIQTVTARRG